MKKRIKIDSFILISTVVISGIFYQFPKLYLTTPALDNILDFIGVLFLLKGILVRMAARGHKMARSKRGRGLVTSGIYQYVRNPMYLGSFLIGFGFMLIVWPWWTLPVYCVLFFMRFGPQVRKEQKILTEHFGQEYIDYCKQAPAIFPKISDVFKFPVRQVFNWDECWISREKRMIFILITLAVLLESGQEVIVFHDTSVIQTIGICLLAMGFFWGGFWAKYRQA